MHVRGHTSAFLSKWMVPAIITGIIAIAIGAVVYTHVKNRGDPIREVDHDSGYNVCRMNGLARYAHLLRDKVYDCVCPSHCRRGRPIKRSIYHGQYWAHYKHHHRMDYSSRGIGTRLVCECAPSSDPSYVTITYVDPTHVHYECYTISEEQEYPQSITVLINSTNVTLYVFDEHVKRELRHDIAVHSPYKSSGANRPGSFNPDVVPEAPAPVYEHELKKGSQGQNVPRESVNNGSTDATTPSASEDITVDSNCDQFPTIDCQEWVKGQTQACDKATFNEAICIKDEDQCNAMINSTEKLICIESLKCWNDDTPRRHECIDQEANEIRSLRKNDFVPEEMAMVMPAFVSAPAQDASTNPLIAKNKTSPLDLASTDTANFSASSDPSELLTPIKGIDVTWPAADNGAADSASIPPDSVFPEGVDVTAGVASAMYRGLNFTFYHCVNSAALPRGGECICAFSYDPTAVDGVPACSKRIVKGSKTSDGSYDGVIPSNIGVLKSLYTCKNDDEIPPFCVSDSLTGTFTDKQDKAYGNFQGSVQNDNPAHTTVALYKNARYALGKAALKMKYVVLAYSSIRFLVPGTDTLCYTPLFKVLPKQYSKSSYASGLPNGYGQHAIFSGDVVTLVDINGYRTTVMISLDLIGDDSSTFAWVTGSGSGYGFYLQAVDTSNPEVVVPSSKGYYIPTSAVAGYCRSGEFVGGESVLEYVSLSGSPKEQTYRFKGSGFADRDVTEVENYRQKFLKTASKNGYTINFYTYFNVHAGGEMARLLVPFAPLLLKSQTPVITNPATGNLENSTFWNTAVFQYICAHDENNLIAAVLAEQMTNFANYIFFYDSTYDEWNGVRGTGDKTLIEPLKSDRAENENYLLYGNEEVKKYLPPNTSNEKGKEYWSMAVELLTARAVVQTLTKANQKYNYIPNTSAATLGSVMYLPKSDYQMLPCSQLFMHRKTNTSSLQIGYNARQFGCSYQQFQVDPAKLKSKLCEDFTTSYNMSMNTSTFNVTNGTYEDGHIKKAITVTTALKMLKLNGKQICVNDSAFRDYVSSQKFAATEAYGMLGRIQHEARGVNEIDKMMETVFFNNEPQEENKLKTRNITRQVTDPNTGTTTEEPVLLYFPDSKERKNVSLYDYYMQYFIDFPTHMVDIVMKNITLPNLRAWKATPANKTVFQKKFLDTAPPGVKSMMYMVGAMKRSDITALLDFSKDIQECRDLQQFRKSTDTSKALQAERCRQGFTNWVGAKKQAIVADAVKGSFRRRRDSGASKDLEILSASLSIAFTAVTLAMKGYQYHYTGSLFPNNERYSFSNMGYDMRARARLLDTMKSMVSVNPSEESINFAKNMVKRTSGYYMSKNGRNGFKALREPDIEVTPGHGKAYTYERFGVANVRYRGFDLYVGDTPLSQQALLKVDKDLVFSTSYHDFLAAAQKGNTALLETDLRGDIGLFRTGYMRTTWMDTYYGRETVVIQGKDIPDLTMQKKQLTAEFTTTKFTREESGLNYGKSTSLLSPMEDQFKFAADTKIPVAHGDIEGTLISKEAIADFKAHLKEAYFGSGMALCQLAAIGTEAAASCEKWAKNDVSDWGTYATCVGGILIDVVGGSLDFWNIWRARSQTKAFKTQVELQENGQDIVSTDNVEEMYELKISNKAVQSAEEAKAFNEDTLVEAAKWGNGLMAATTVVSLGFAVYGLYEALKTPTKPDANEESRKANYNAVTGTTKSAITKLNAANSIRSLRKSNKGKYTTVSYLS
eukprot:Nk52_evm3s1271 gene=Nk52_evmTU3s1271